MDFKEYGNFDYLEPIESEGMPIVWSDTLAALGVETVLIGDVEHRVVDGEVFEKLSEEDRLGS